MGNAFTVTPVQFNVYPRHAIAWAGNASIMLSVSPVFRGVSSQRNARNVRNVTK